MNEILKSDYPKDPIHCKMNHTIQEAAQLMTKYLIGSIIVCNEDLRPLGIITDKDLRTKVVAGHIQNEEYVTSIMSSPVICVKPSLSITELQIIMIKNKINHLAVTEDGTPQTKLLGVVSDHDLMVQQADNPAIFIKEIRKCTSSDHLKIIRNKIDNLISKYLEKEVAISFITQIVAELNDEIIRQCITIAELKIGDEIKNIKYCWVTLGSEGREEQTLMTDQDNAIIYESNNNIFNIKNICHCLAQEVNAMLHEIGYDYCPANLMASNPMWCQSIEEWKNLFSGWINNPEENSIMMCSIFFDFRPVYGDQKLAENLRNHILNLLDQQDIFIHLLAKNTLQNPPPLSFFQNFVLEKNGKYKNFFDIKLRAMSPLVDAARLLILSRGIMGINNTFKRFSTLAENEPNNAELYQMAVSAFQTQIRIRTMHGLKNRDSGRFIKPDVMNRMEKIHLKNTFLPIIEIQKLVKIRFQLTGLL